MRLRLARMTYNQAKELGAPGWQSENHHRHLLHFTGKSKLFTGEKTDESRRVLKAYPVFNADRSKVFRNVSIRRDACEQGRRAELDLIASIPAVLRQGDEAYYEPIADRVTMPPAHLSRASTITPAAHELRIDRRCQPP